MTAPSPRRRTGGVWWWIAAVAAALLVLWLYWAWGWGAREPLEPPTPETSSAPRPPPTA
ncbi:MAG TPA: hypothetical protein VHM02_06140 [Thermoanaerobaculia bacterium]|nr:hypothetical protein [Thermoanaerobaculia bacterium]